MYPLLCGTEGNNGLLKTSVEEGIQNTFEQQYYKRGIKPIIFAGTLLVDCEKVHSRVNRGEKGGYIYMF